MLCPRKDDPNYEAEAKRYKEAPHEFGTPGIKVASTKDQRELAGKDKK